jgi:hypothetical protein
MEFCGLGPHLCHHNRLLCLDFIFFLRRYLTQAICHLAEDIHVSLVLLGDLSQYLGEHLEFCGVLVLCVEYASLSIFETSGLFFFLLLVGDLDTTFLNFLGDFFLSDLKLLSLLLLIPSLFLLEAFEILSELCLEVSRQVLSELLVLRCSIDRLGCGTPSDLGLRTQACELLPMETLAWGNGVKIVA